MDYQKMIIVGNATKDAELHRSKGKPAYADFTLAVSRTKDRTTFFPVRVFGKLAEGCDNIRRA
jgi:single-stranded DNA-binding protein